MVSTCIDGPSLPLTLLYDVHLHTSAPDFLSVAYEIMRNEERSSNILLAHADKRLAEEDSEIRPSASGKVSQTISQINDTTSPPAAVASEFWLTVWTKTEYPQPLVFLSCINWELGDYPIFLWSPRANTDIAPEERIGQLAALVQRLRSQTDPQRVFSVFGQTKLVTTFAELWKEETGFETEPNSFYDALLTYCTKDTFKLDPPSFTTSFEAPNTPAGHAMRLADLDDLTSVAERCKEFSVESIYFQLTPERAKEEADLLIRKKQVWVYAVDGEAVSICAVTRSTENVAAITKVFTTPTFRKKGFAERLVRMVTKHLLEEKSAVILYVGVENDAQHVYNKIGFVGLCGHQDPDVETALELGFKQTTRGYW